MDPSRHVIIVSWPGRGHINPIMILSRQLIARGVHVTFVVTEEWFNIISSSQPSPPPEINFRTIPNCIPSENNRAKNFDGFLEAVYTKMRESFEELLDRLDPLPKAIIADLPWMIEVGNKRGIPVISIVTMSATFFSVWFNFEKISRPESLSTPIREDDECLGKCISNLSPIKLTDVDSLFTGTGTRLVEHALQVISSAKKSQCIIFSSFYELESRFINSLIKDINCPIYTLGPFVPYMIEPKLESGYFTWLDSQPKKSVLYISLGSFLSVSPSQLEEIAIGVRLSEVRFLWIVRENASLVKEMCGEKGLVLSWCDQLNVLKNPSVGGFLTHCGFNSTLETLFAGVPVLCLPIIWDQLINKRLLVDEWKIGFDLKDKMGKDGIVRREEVARAVRKLMDSGDSEIRKSAVYWSEASRKAIEKGGSSFQSLSSFIDEFVDN